MAIVRSILIYAVTAADAMSRHAE